MLGEKNKETSSSVEARHCTKIQQNRFIVQTPIAVATGKSKIIPDSLLPPHFGFLDRSEVRVIDHAVLVGLGGGNDPAGRKHGVLLLSSRIILEDKTVAQGTKVHLFILGNVEKELEGR